MAGDLYLEEGVPRIFEMFIKPIRDLDRKEGRDFLKRFLKRPDELWKELLERIRSLSTLDDPALIREDLLDAMLWDVAFTSELSAITSRLSAATKRKLIRVAIPLWKRLGSRMGLFQWLRFLAGRNPRYLDFFDYQWIVGETEVGADLVARDSWIIGGSVSPNDEFISSVRVMDDGTLDRKLVVDLVDLSRPMNERIEVAILDFLDTFFEGRNLWSNKALPIGTAVGNELVLAPGCEEEAVMASSIYSGYSWSHRFRLGAGCVHKVIWNRVDANNFLSLELKASAPEVVLKSTSAGVPTTLGSVSVGSFDILDGVDYQVRVDTLGSTPRQIQVYVDGVRVLDVSDASSGPFRGTFRLHAPGTNAQNNVVDDVEVWRNPLRFATVGPDGISTSSNFLT